MWLPKDEVVIETVYCMRHKLDGLLESTR